MSDRVFIDSNILVYIYSEDEKAKKLTSQNLVRENNCFISTQVIQELVNTLRKKYKADWSSIRNAIDEINNECAIFTNHAGTIHQATLIAEKYKYSFYDSLIIASALETNCTVLYSEDMQHKQIINGTLQIINPFLN